MRLRCSYRVQLSASFDLHEAEASVAYLSELGASHLHTSPMLQAVQGSTHGYDVVDPTHVSEELGGLSALNRLTHTLRSRGLGHVLDIVPNHMACAASQNAWWWDVLENGRSSRYASFFDIHWDDERGSSHGRVLVPVLEQPYGATLEAHDIQLQRRGGAFVATYKDDAFPLSPPSIGLLLTAAATTAQSTALTELAAELDALSSARQPGAAELTRYDMRRHLADDLAAICESDERARSAIDKELRATETDLDGIDALLGKQHYRLAHWRVANEELNYRRFFTVDTLIGVRVEDDEVFTAVHDLVLRLIRDRVLDGLRVDHVDGLLDPMGYLEHLAQATSGVYTVVEKVLSDDETLCGRWPVAGTTGYDFCAHVTGLFVDPSNEAAFTQCYRAFSGDGRSFSDIVHDAKLEVLANELASEVSRLTSMLAEICALHRSQRDRTRRELRDAVVELLAAFDVYRTYVTPARPIDDENRMRIDRALTTAGGRRADLDPGLFAFLGEVLQLRHPGGSEVDFSLALQQLCPPVMAKGVEDRAFYRYHRLLALNEVGGDPGSFGTSPSTFHAFASRMASEWPMSMLALSTHDTKRSADVRARLCALSEFPGPWRDLVYALDLTTRDARPASLDACTRYLFFQTAIGAWPISTPRAVDYMRKAARESGVHTSWRDPAAHYEDDLERFVTSALEDGAFSAVIERFLATTRLVEHGRGVSLALVALQLTCPGIPDLYQGSELWDLSLVDPDNRRPVDFALRARLLSSLGSAVPKIKLADDDEGLLKLWLVTTLLRHRAANPGLYETTRYAPLPLHGGTPDRVVAFQRDRLAVVVPRLTASVTSWDTAVELPPGRWIDVLSGTAAEGVVEVRTLTRAFPVAVLAASDKADTP